MANWRRALAVTSIVCMLGTPALAQQTLWFNAIESGRKAYVAGRFDEAEKFFVESLKAARAMNDTGYRLERSLVNLGTAYKEQAKYEDADKMLRAAILLCESGDKATKDDMPLALNNMASLRAVQGQFDESMSYYKQSLELSNRQFGQNNIATGLPLNNLASLMIHNGQYDQAYALLKPLYLAFEKHPKQQRSLEYIYTIFNLAVMGRDRGYFENSENVYNKSIKLAQELLGADHKYLAGGYESIAELYIIQDRYDEAERAIKRAIEIQKKASSPESPDTARSLQALAKCYVKEGKYAEALPLINAAKIIFERNFGPDNVFCTEPASLLARVREQNGEYAEAEKLLLAALRIREKGYGISNPNVRSTLRQLGECYYDWGKYDQAEEYLTRALSIKESTDGQHPDIPEVKLVLARCYVEQNKLDEAENVYNQALGDLEKMFGKDSAKYTDALREMAELNILQRKYKEASVALLAVITADEKFVDTKGMDESSKGAAKLSADYAALAKIAGGLGDLDRAKTALAKSEELKKSLPGAQFIQQAQQHATPTPTPTAAAETPVADKWALVVGISNFKDPSINLKYATKDAIDFRNYLVGPGHFQPDHVKLLTDAQATRENIISQLGDKWLGRLANRDDLVVIYVSSHGSSAQESAGGVNFLVAHDTRKDSLLATGIPMQWLNSIVKDQIHADRIVMILDVCHGAAAAGASKALLRTNGVDVDGLALGKGQAVLCSSLADQLSWESKTYQNSVFTRRLIEALNSDGDKTTLSAAYKYLRDSVESEVLRDRGQLQTPVLNQKLWVGTDAKLGVKPAKPRPGLSFQN